MPAILDAFRCSYQNRLAGKLYRRAVGGGGKLFTRKHCVRRIVGDFIRQPGFKVGDAMGVGLMLGEPLCIGPVSSRRLARMGGNLRLYRRGLAEHERRLMPRRRALMPEVVPRLEPDDERRQQDEADDSDHK